jgi:beta-N-acetylglucosaminidase
MAMAVVLSLQSALSISTVCAQSGDTEKAREYVIFTEKNIKTEDMRKKSDLSEEQLSEYLQKFPKLLGIEGALISAQEDYEVNAVLILAIIRLESGNGKSRLATSKNNLGGLVSRRGKTATVYQSFDTKDDCVEYMARLLSNHYLTKGGKFFKGYTLGDIAKTYCTSSTKWTNLVSTLIYEIQKSIDKL